MHATPIATHNILSLVPAEERQRLVAEYAARGGSWPALTPRENPALLEFLAQRLPDPSHALSLCRMQRALLRAQSGALRFVEPEYRPDHAQYSHDVREPVEREAWACIERALHGHVAQENWEHIDRRSWDSVEAAIWDGIQRDARERVDAEAWRWLEHSDRIARGPYASLVWFHAPPEVVLQAMHGAALPPVGAASWPVLFGPGVPNLCRVVTAEEAELWTSLPADGARPDLVERMLSEGLVVYAQ